MASHLLTLGRLVKLAKWTDQTVSGNRRIQKPLSPISPTPKSTVVSWQLLIMQGKLVICSRSPDDLDSMESMYVTFSCTKWNAIHRGEQQIDNGKKARMLMSLGRIGHSGLTFQISSAYCWIVRSLENQPLLAEFRMLIRSQRSWSR